MLDLKDHNGKIDIKSMTPEELEAFLKELGEKPFRAKQIYDWLHVKLAERFEEMTSISKELQRKLDEACSLTCLRVVDEKVSNIDGTRKYLFALADGNIIESVWMQYHHGNSVCISSQAAAAWAAVSAPPPWTGWRGTCGRRRCWTRSTGFSGSPENGCQTWW